MMQENDIRKLVEDVLSSIISKSDAAPTATGSAAPVVEEGFAPDVTAVSTREEFHVPNPADREGYLKMKQYSVARIGVWRAGPRYNTMSMLHFRADHATAQDAVFTDVDDQFAADNGLIAGQSTCKDKDEYLTRPDKGRILNDETVELFNKELPKGQKVTIMVGDGLSSAAMINIPDIVPAIKQGLKGYGIEVGPIPYVKYCRVGAEDHLGEIIDSDVICQLIGERPGLATGESMSAYIVYKPNRQRPESWRTVVSNIYRDGTPPVEAGAHIATLIKKILDEKVSGVDLNL